MVFESVVVDVLNRFLGDYVVNLDSSQLSLGIWGGDAILRNLEIKENALSQLDIPFKVRAGHIGIKYDAEKEERQLQEARQRELQRIEESKQKAAEKENPKAEKQDTFVEKLVTQVIKNLQVKISNIHVRYEDDVTNPNAPLSFGVSLQNLSLQTADQNWKPCLLDEKAKLFFKLVRLDNLFAYWNVNSELYSNHNPDEALRYMKHSVAIQSSVPQDYHFIFRPISANAKLRMNPRSDVDFSSPKVDLVVNLPEVAVELSRPQETERTLDIFNITMARQQAEMEASKAGFRIYRPGVQVEEEQSQGWFGWMWSWSGDSSTQTKDVKTGVTMAKRKNFSPILKKMKALGLQPFLMYPVVIKLWHNGKQMMFDSTKKAEDFISSLPQKKTYAAALQSNRKATDTVSISSVQRGELNDGDGGGDFNCPGEENNKMDMDTG
ncbi:hypothetical protein cypCar_00012668 [Cyprinus carpio]|nr:hypothetical protein cypCar_00012668 [Cyprinus carpio]